MEKLCALENRNCGGIFLSKWIEVPQDSVIGVVVYWDVEWLTKQYCVVSMDSVRMNSSGTIIFNLC